MWVVKEVVKLFNYWGERMKEGPKKRKKSTHGCISSWINHQFGVLIELNCSRQTDRYVLKFALCPHSLVHLIHFLWLATIYYIQNNCSLVTLILLSRSKPKRASKQFIRSIRESKCDTYFWWPTTGWTSEWKTVFKCWVEICFFIFSSYVPNWLSWNGLADLSF